MAEPPFLAPYKAAAPEFGAAFTQLMEATYAPSALEPKFKILIALALDTAFGTTHGVENVARVAREAGATDAEIVDTMKVAVLAAAMQQLAVGASSFPDAGGAAEH